MGSDGKCEDGSYTAPYSENCVPIDSGRGNEMLVTKVCDIVTLCIFVYLCQGASRGLGLFAHYCTKVIGRDSEWLCCPRFVLTSLICSR